MSRILWRPRFRDGAFSLGIGLMILSLLLLPKQSVSAAGDGVQLCLQRDSAVAVSFLCTLNAVRGFWNY